MSSGEEETCQLLILFYINKFPSQVKTKTLSFQFPYWNGILDIGSILVSEYSKMDYFFSFLLIWLVRIVVYAKLLLLQIQIFGFNSQLYTNFSEALYRAQGVVAISLLLQVSWFTISVSKIQNSYLYLSKTVAAYLK